jgi:MFS family permease
MSSPAPHEALDRRPWWSHMSKYHWYVFVLCAMGWLFDTMDQQIFVLSRAITMKELLPDASFAEQTKAGGHATMSFIFGWATGGLVFGAVGDRWGRAKTMALTILIYAVFTGLSGLCRTPLEFMICRFVTGLGVGGEFAAGAALVAEVMPQKARAQALGFLQSLSTVGNVTGALLFAYVEPLWGWQGLYFVGAFPALLAVIVRVGLKEPEAWVAAKKAAEEAGARGEAVKFGSYTEMFRHPRWRKHTLVGLALAVSGVFCLWGVGFYSPELIESNYPVVEVEVRESVAKVLDTKNDDEHKAAFTGLSAEAQKAFLMVARRAQPPRTKFNEDAAKASPLSEEHKTRFRELLAKAKTAKEMTSLKARGGILQNVGAFFGIYAFSLVASRIGRRPAFLIAFLLGWFSIALTFLTFNHESQMWYLWPILGFGTLAPFGGYAVYFPELYPTSLRTTGTGFCYNVGRYASGLAPVALGALALALEGRFETPSFRVASVIAASAYLLGIVALIWAPETKDQPLPAEERGLSH